MHNDNDHCIGWQIAKFAGYDSASSGPTKEIMVIGGGFGGLSTVENLRKTGAQIWLVDRRNHHVFQPLLYQVATAALSPAEIGYPIRRVFRKRKDVHVVMDELIALDLHRNVAIFPQGEANYDYLILACGATHSYFGRDDWAKFAPGLKSIEDALEIRSRVLMAFEEAEMNNSAKPTSLSLSSVVVQPASKWQALSGKLPLSRCQTTSATSTQSPLGSS